MKTWYTVYTKSKQEALAQEHLQRQSYETYLPMLQSKVWRRSKWTPRVEPLFPRYLFIRLDLEIESSATLRSTRGVSQLVRFGNEPAVVPTRLVDDLRQAEDANTGLHRRDTRSLIAGDAVRILDGPFKDVYGIFEAASGQSRALILLDLIGRQSRLNIGVDRLVTVT